MNVTEDSVAVLAGKSESQELTYRILTWRLVPFLMLCYVSAYLDRVNVSFAKLQMLGDLRIGDAAYGVGAAAFFVGYIMFGLPSSMMVRKVGAKAGLALIMLVWGVLSGLMAFVVTPVQFLVLRFLLGVAESGFYPGVILYLTRWFPSQRRARVLSMFQSAIALSGILGGPLSGWTLDHFDHHWHLRGWQWLFLVEALPAVLLGLIALAYLHDDLGSVRWLNPQQKTCLMRDIAQQPSYSERHRPQNVFIECRVWAIGVLVLGLSMGLYAVSFWMPTLLRDVGTLSATEVGWLSAIPNLVAVVSMYLFARSSDRQRERRGHVAAAAMLGAMGLVITVWFSHNLALALLGLVMALSGIMSALPMTWSMLTTFVTESDATVAVAIVTSIGNLGGAVSPIFIGWMTGRSGSVTLGMYSIAFGVAVSAMIALALPARLANR